MREGIRTRCRRLAAAAVVATAALALAACSPPGSGLESLDVYERDQADADILPADLDEGIARSVDPASTRFLIEHEGIAFYSAHGVDPDLDACLVLVGPEPMAGCGTGMPVQVGPSAGPGVYALAPTMPDGWTQLTDGLWHLADPAFSR